MRSENMAAPLLKFVEKQIKYRIFTLRHQIPLVPRLFMCDWKEDEFAKNVHIGETGFVNRWKVHPETVVKGEHDVIPIKGKIYDKKPFPIKLQANKKYAWCVCGHSKSQPLCDGYHKRVYKMLKEEKDKTKFSPHIFTVDETKEYWLCNCKQTDNRPFCDGTHKRDDIQAKRLLV